MTMRAFAVFLFLTTMCCGGGVVSPSDPAPAEPSAPASAPPPPTSTTLHAPEAPSPPSCSGSYPALVPQLARFDARRTSELASVRVELLRDVAGIVDLPDADRFARDIAACDTAPTVRGAAVDSLVRNGHAIDDGDLPLGIGEPGQQYPVSLESARAMLRLSGSSAGWAAHYLSVFGEDTDVPALEAVTTDTNVFARYAAAMAVAARGRVDRAGVTLDAIGRLGAEPENLFYVERALLGLHAMGDPSALADLVAFLAEIEQRSEPNADVHTRRVLLLLTLVTGAERTSAAAWHDWLVENGKVSTSTRRHSA